MVEAALGNDGSVRIRLSRDGEEAIRVAREWKPDLLFVDVDMPKKDGFEVCETLKGAPETAHIKVVMLTGLADRSGRFKALVEVGADDYITKPFSPIELFRKFEGMRRDHEMSG